MVSGKADMRETDSKKSLKNFFSLPVEFSYVY
jgi:hypothetical protein